MATSTDAAGNATGAERDTGRVLLDAVLVLAIVAAALAMRFPDPLSSSVMPAEDPYTHLVFTREHVERGYFDDSFHLDTGLYPPGLHAFTGIAWSITGGELYPLMLYGAPLWGALGAAGAFVLGRRLAGTAAGVAAGVLVAFIPEHVLRSNIYVPSAFDLALLPFLLLAFVEASEGRREWLVPGVLVGLALLFAHPWVIPLTLVPVLGYLLARPLLARWDRDAEAPDARGSVIAGVAALALIAFALRFRWDASDSGFGDFAGQRNDEVFMNALFAIVNPVTLLIGAVAVVLVLWLARAGRRRAAATAAAVGIAGVLAIVIPTVTYSLPLHVNYVEQLGWLPIALALLGLVALPFAPGNRLTLMGAMIAGVTFPLTAINFFNSPFLPHRTVAYLSVGVALLGAGFIATVVRLARGTRLGASGRLGARRATQPALAVGLALVLGGALVGPGAASPDPWYRYFEDDEFEGFRFVEARLEENPNALALTGDWRANMVMKSLSPELGRAMYSDEYYDGGGEHGQINGMVQGSGGVLYVIVDEYRVKERGEPWWTQDGQYRQVWSDADGTLRVYAYGGGS